jgi:hypothetical protein
MCPLACGFGAAVGMVEAVENTGETRAKRPSSLATSSNSAECEYFPFPFFFFSLTNDNTGPFCFLQ